MRRTLALALLLALATAGVIMAALTIINVLEYHIQAERPFLVKLRGEDSGNPAYNVKHVEAWWSGEGGYNVTYVEITVPRCHTARFYPALYFRTLEAVDARVVLEKLSGSYTSSLTTTIYLNGTEQIEISGGSVVQGSGPSVSVPAGGRGDFNVEVLVSSSAPLGAEVARLYTWLEYIYGHAVIKQRVVWVIKTFASPPVVTLFADDFEDGDLANWSNTTYVYNVEKTGNLTVYEHCYSRPATPNPVNDTALPTSGTRMMMIGHRDVYCEPNGPGNDYARLGLSVPGYIDNVEVKYLRVGLNYRMLTWDSANYDYLNISMSRAGGSTYYIVSNYNPNPGNKYGPFNDSGWQSVEELFGNVAGSDVVLEILLHTYSDSLYKSWVYVDDVQVQVYFDCVASPHLLTAPTKILSRPRRPPRMPRGRG